MIVSTLSVFLSGSKRTRLLKQGIAGQTVEIVAVSWMAKPCARSSRSIMLCTPPDFGVWLVAGGELEFTSRTYHITITACGWNKRSWLYLSIGSGTTEV